MPGHDSDVAPATELRAHPRATGIGSAFAPGTLIAGRFRIVSRVGAGGMGEVYRADDLKLSQPVALKRLSPSLRSRRFLELLYDEVRIGRQISHPNVCRLYDLVETSEDSFVAMEFVEGENLQSLLRRIGRLPHAKGVQVSHDVAAGLAAIHDRGVIHRDLKPGNVMIDDTGRARITDFGLAAPQAEAAGGVLAGTPAYMAPEVLAGRPPTAESDVFALGLVLYEAFTGRRAFDGGSVRELRSAHAVPATPPSRYCPDIDPSMERAILCCLEPDPRSRPLSGAAVGLLLPPVDDLRAAIEAGVTPAPDQVARSGKAGTLKAVSAWPVLLLTLGLLLIVASVYGRIGLHHGLAAGRSTQALETRAREILESIGVQRPVESHGWWSAVRPESPAAPAAPVYVHRESWRRVPASSEWGRWTLQDPSGPGISTVVLEPGGRLLWLAVADDGRRAAVRDPWPALLAAAGLDAAALRQAAPRHVPPVGNDALRSWIEPGTGKRVDAASARGMPVFLAAAGGESLPGRVENRVEPDLGFPLSLFIATATAGLALACVFARFNAVRGRGDRRGAFRVATYVLGTTFAAFIALADHSMSLPGEWRILMRAAGAALLHAAQIWIVYTALEPFVRRMWPQLIVSWSRMIAGRLRDPMIGRDVLVGLAAGLLGRLILMVDEIALPLPGIARAGPHGGMLLTLGDPSAIAFVLLYYQYVALYFSLGCLFLLVVLRRMTGSERLALVVLWVVISLMAVSGTNVPVELTLSLLRNGLLVWVLYRFGVLSLAAAWLVYYVTIRVPLTLDVAAWFWDRSLLVLSIVTAMAIWAFRLSLGGRPALARLLAERPEGRSPAV